MKRIIDIEFMTYLLGMPTGFSIWMLKILYRNKRFTRGTENHSIPKASSKITDASGSYITPCVEQRTYQATAEIVQNKELN